MEILFDKIHQEHAKKYSDVQLTLAILDTEFKAPGAESEWFYPSADIFVMMVNWTKTEN
ncbi:hypothetical protein Ptr902_01623 [Pyrenophora tritici-repentis]|nr:hypothetical protein Ptr902_01623 [Pyrenophora tritici-repentis]